MESVRDCELVDFDRPDHHIGDEAQKQHLLSENKLSREEIASIVPFFMIRTLNFVRRRWMMLGGLIILITVLDVLIFYLTEKNPKLHKVEMFFSPTFADAELKLSGEIKKSSLTTSFDVTSATCAYSYRKDSASEYKESGELFFYFPRETNNATHYDVTIQAMDTNYDALRRIYWDMMSKEEIQSSVNFDCSIQLSAVLYKIIPSTYDLHWQRELFLNDHVELTSKAASVFHGNDGSKASVSAYLQQSTTSEMTIHAMFFEYVVTYNLAPFFGEDGIPVDSLIVHWPSISYATTMIDKQNELKNYYVIETQAVTVDLVKPSTFVMGIKIGCTPEGRTLDEALESDESCTLISPLNIFEFKDEISTNKFINATAQAIESNFIVSFLGKTHHVRTIDRDMGVMNMESFNTRQLSPYHISDPSIPTGANCVTLDADGVYISQICSMKGSSFFKIYVGIFNDDGFTGYLKSVTSWAPSGKVAFDSELEGAIISGGDELKVFGDLFFSEPLQTMTAVIGLNVTGMQLLLETVTAKWNFTQQLSGLLETKSVTTVYGFKPLIIEADLNYKNAKYTATALISDFITATANGKYSQKGSVWTATVDKSSLYIKEYLLGKFIATMKITPDATEANKGYMDLTMGLTDSADNVLLASNYTTVQWYSNSLWETDATWMVNSIVYQQDLESTTNFITRNVTAGMGYASNKFSMGMLLTPPIDAKKHKAHAIAHTMSTTSLSTFIDHMGHVDHDLIMSGHGHYHTDSMYNWGISLEHMELHSSNSLILEADFTTAVDIGETGERGAIYYHANVTGDLPVVAFHRYGYAYCSVSLIVPSNTDYYLSDNVVYALKNTLATIMGIDYWLVEIGYNYFSSWESKWFINFYLNGLPYEQLESAMAAINDVNAMTIFNTTLASFASSTDIDSIYPYTSGYMGGYYYPGYSISYMSHLFRTVHWANQSIHWNSVHGWEKDGAMSVNSKMMFDTAANWNVNGTCHYMSNRFRCAVEETAFALAPQFDDSSDSTTTRPTSFPTSRPTVHPTWAGQNEALTYRSHVHANVIGNYDFVDSLHWRFTVEKAEIIASADTFLTSANLEMNLAEDGHYGTLACATKVTALLANRDQRPSSINLRLKIYGVTIPYATSLENAIVGRAIGKIIPIDEIKLQVSSYCDSSAYYNLYYWPKMQNCVCDFYMYVTVPSGTTDADIESWRDLFTKSALQSVLASTAIDGGSYAFNHSYVVTAELDDWYYRESAHSYSEGSPFRLFETNQKLNWQSDDWSSMGHIAATSQMHVPYAADWNVSGTFHYAANKYSIAASKQKLARQDVGDFSFTASGTYKGIDSNIWSGTIDKMMLVTPLFTTNGSANIGLNLASEGVIGDFKIGSKLTIGYDVSTPTPSIDSPFIYIAKLSFSKYSTYYLTDNDKDLIITLVSNCLVVVPDEIAIQDYVVTYNSYDSYMVQYAQPFFDVDVTITVTNTVWDRNDAYSKFYDYWSKLSWSSVNTEFQNLLSDSDFFKNSTLLYSYPYGFDSYDPAITHREQHNIAASHSSKWSTKAGWATDGSYIGSALFSFDHLNMNASAVMKLTSTAYTLSMGETITYDDWQDEMSIKSSGTYSNSGTKVTVVSKEANVYHNSDLVSKMSGDVTLNTIDSSSTSYLINLKNRPVGDGPSPLACNMTAMVKGAYGSQSDYDGWMSVTNSLLNVNGIVYLNMRGFFKGIFTPSGEKTDMIGNVVLYNGAQPSIDYKPTDVYPTDNALLYTNNRFDYSLKNDEEFHIGISTNNEILSSPLFCVRTMFNVSTADQNAFIMFYDSILGQDGLDTWAEADYDMSTGMLTSMSGEVKYADAVIMKSAMSFDLNMPAPTVKPTFNPTLKPTVKPTVKVPTAPTLNPTAVPKQPTFPPTTRPTATPTIAPTKASKIEFSASQSFSGIDYTTFMQNQEANELALKQTIAACMTGITKDDITDLTITDTTSSAARRMMAQMSLGRQVMVIAEGSKSIAVSYKVVVASSPISYDTLVSQLNTKISSGEFDTILETNSAAAGGNLSGISASPVETVNLVDDSSSKKSGLSGAIIAIIVVVVVVGSIAIIGAIAYFKCFGSNVNAVSPANVPSAPPGSPQKVASSTEMVATNGYSNVVNV